MKQLLACAGLLALGLARPATAQTRRAVYGLQLWPELQAELALKNGDYLLLSARGQRYTDNPSSEYDGRSLGFDERRLTFGYEHFWSEYWSAGATARVQSFGSRQLVLVPEVLLRHRGHVGPLTFGQRLSLERTFPNNAGYYGGPGPDGQTFARLRADLEKTFTVGSFGLRPRLSYEAVTHVRLLRADTDAKERTIQFTSLRAEVGCRLGQVVDLTPWFAYQTSYYFALEQSGPSGTIPAGRVNIVSPVLGIDLRVTIPNGQNMADRKQLPTQH